MSAWCGPGDPPAGAGPRSGGRASGRRGRCGRCARPGGSLLCPWPCALVRFAAPFLALVPVVVGVLLLLVAVRADRRRGGCARRCGRGLPGRAGGRVARGPGGSTWRRACWPPGRADLGPGWSTWCRIAGGVAGILLLPAW